MAKKTKKLEMPQYRITNDHITVVVDDTPYVTRKASDAARYKKLRDALHDNDAATAIELSCTGKGIEVWSNGAFEFRDNRVYYKGEAIDDRLTGRMIAMAENEEDPTFLMAFHHRLQQNPSNRSVDQLYSFLEHIKIPIERDGSFLAYKGVKQNYMDAHSGKFENRPGAVMEMERNRISDDPNAACAEGFHVGSLRYAKEFAARLMIVRVDPANVVSVPYDSSCEKMRVCRYEVVAEYGAELPSTTLPDNFFDMDPIAIAPTLLESPAQKVEAHRVKSKRRSKVKRETLEAMGIRELRIMAGSEYHIIGASKIPGGKDALIDRMLAVAGE